MTSVLIDLPEALVEDLNSIKLPEETTISRGWTPTIAREQFAGVRVVVSCLAESSVRSSRKSRKHTCAVQVLIVKEMNADSGESQAAWNERIDPLARLAQTLADAISKASLSAPKDAEGNQEWSDAVCTDDIVCELSPELLDLGLIGIRMEATFTLTRATP